MDFTDMELLYLFRLVRDDLGRLERRCKHLEMVYDRTRDREKRQDLEKKLALVISEYRTLDPLLKRLADEISFIEFQKKMS